MNKERFEDIVVLRSAFTILVVFVHSFYVYNYGLLVDVESSFLSVERTVTSEFINKFMMPMFIFISGYLFSYLHYKKHRYSKFIDLFRNKFKRLVLPYCVFLPITALSLGKLKLSVDILLFPMGHLWFLLMLFWCFVITKIILEMHLDKSKVSMFFLLLLFYSLSFFSGYVKNILGLADFVRDYMFFFLGFIINKFDNSVIKDTTTKKMLLFVVVAIACFFLVVELKSQFRYSLARILSPSSSISIVLLCFVLINRMLKCRWIRISPIWENLDKLSFGIYITHPWFMNVVTANKSVLVIAKEHYIIFPIILFIVALFISIIFSKIMLRMKIGRFLIG